MIKKRKKFALSLKVLSLLSCIAVLSVGFASWIIIQQPAQQNEAGTITTYTAASAGMELETEWVGGVNPEIIFGLPKDLQVDENTWLSGKKSDGVNYDMEEENLEAVLKVYYIITDSTLDNITFTLTATAATEAAAAATAFSGLLDTNEDKNLLAVPTLQAFKEEGCTNKLCEATPYNTSLVLNTSLVGLATEVKNAKTYNVFYVKVQFGWGKVFNSINPFNYYNQFQSNTTTTENANLFEYGDKTVAGQIAEAALKALDTTMLNNENPITFNLNVNGKVNAEE